jgi:hypothetical protein
MSPMGANKPIEDSEGARPPFLSRNWLIYLSFSVIPLPPFLVLVKRIFRLEVRKFLNFSDR